jgi:lincosamide nucleotidyltransferase A/C/D/E
MDAERVLDLLGRLEDRGIPAWLDGGWGVDALLGTQTRPHDDLDILFRLDDTVELEQVLAEVGYVRAHGAPPFSFELVDPEGHQVDAHPLSFKPEGDGVYKLANGEDWVYPVGTLTAKGTILGREVRCQSPEMQILAHTAGYALDAVHRNDVTALSERFGLPLPAFRSAD